jgi:hypothetical protein
VKNWRDIPEIFEIFGTISDVSHIDKTNVKKYRYDIPELVKECAVGNYNNFLSNVIKNVGDDILNKIIETSIGVETIDGFIPREDLEFRWTTKQQWLGFNRHIIEFRIKQSSQLSLTLKKEVYKLIESVNDKDTLIEDLILQYYNKK